MDIFTAEVFCERLRAAVLVTSIATLDRKEENDRRQRACDFLWRCLARAFPIAMAVGTFPVEARFLHG